MIVNYWYRIRLVGIMYCVPPAYVNTQGEIGSQTRVIIVLMILTPPSCQFSYLTIVCKFTFSKFSVCFKGSNTKKCKQNYPRRQLLFCVNTYHMFQHETLWFALDQYLCEKNALYSISTYWALLFMCYVNNHMLFLFNGNFYS